MTPRITSFAVAAMLLATPALASQVTVTNSNIPAGGGDPTTTQMTAELGANIEFESVGSFFVDFEEDGEAFIMIVHDDVDGTASPLASDALEEYRFAYDGAVIGEFEIATEGSTAALADNADVQVENGEIVITLMPGAEILAGNRIVVSFADLVGDYSDGDLIGAGAGGDD